MKKILGMMIAAMLITNSAFAAFVHLTKPGTQWVWRVEDGKNESYFALESGDALLLEDGNKVLLLGENSSEALYNALVGQGWILTTDDANIPQGIIEASAKIYSLALLEDDSVFATEDANQLKLEN